MLDFNKIMSNSNVSLNSSILFKVYGWLYTELRVLISMALGHCLFRHNWIDSARQFLQNIQNVLNAEHGQNDFIASIYKLYDLTGSTCCDSPPSRGKQGLWSSSKNWIKLYKYVDKRNTLKNSNISEQLAGISFVSWNRWEIFERFAKFLKRTQ